MTDALFAADSRGLAAVVDLWPIWLPLAVGGLAVYCLLPRPKRPPLSLGVTAGVAALLLGGALLVHSRTFSIELVLFYSFAALAVVSGTLLVTQQHPARAALSFALVILSTCGLFLLLAAPFLMAATIIIYAGAIVVTFLFVIMLAQQEGVDNADARSREPLLATLTGFLLLAAILYVVNGYAQTGEYDALLTEVKEVLAKDDLAQMRERVGGEEGEDNLFKRAQRLVNASEGSELDQLLKTAAFDWYSAPEIDLGREANNPTPQTALLKLRSALLAARQRQTVVAPPDVRSAEGTQRRLPLSAMSGTPANTPPGEVRRNPDTLVPELPAENSAFLGRSLFTDYLLPVELGGTLLMVATVGAIALAQRRPEAVRSAGFDGTPGRVV